MGCLKEKYIKKGNGKKETEEWLIFFKNEPLRVNHLIGFGLLILAVYFLFKR